MDTFNDLHTSNTMTYRKAEEKDFPEITELAKSNGFNDPILGICFVAEDEGKIIGYVDGGVIGFIESIVSENPISAVRLACMMEGALQNSGIRPIFAGVINPDAGKELEKFGYREIKETKFYLRN